MKRLRKIMMGLVVLLLLMPACSIQRRAAKLKSTGIDTTQVLVQQVQTTAPKLLTIKSSQVRFTMNYAERVISAGGSIELVKDSAIVISIQPLLGIELLRAEIDQKEVRVIDKMNRRYMRMDYAELAKKTGVPLRYADIEAFCMARMFVVGQSDLTSIHFEREGLVLAYREGLLTYRFEIEPVNNTLQHTELVLGGTENKASVQYEQWILQDEILFPRVFDVVLQTNVLSAAIKIQLQRVVFNDEVNIHSLPLDKYQQVSLSTILK